MGRILLNKFGLPEPVVRAVEFESYQKRGHISVTTLIDSPKVNYLKTTTDYHEDVSEMVWALRGQALHHILERSALEIAKKEEAAGIAPRYKPELKVDYEWEEEGKDTVHITGTMDLLYMVSPETMYDYKDCSYYKISGCEKRYDESGVPFYHPKDGECQDWIKQTNIYAYILRKKYNIVVKKIRIIAFIKDWSKKNTNMSGYPESPIVVVELPIYSDEVMYSYIKNRINLHREYYRLGHTGGADAIPECTEEERWKKKDTIKIYSSPNAARSSKNFEINGQEDEIQAELYFQNFKIKTPTAIKVRVAGFDGRCQDYCSVKVHCHYWRQISQK